MLTFKQKVQNLIFPLGSIQKIRSGYLKGYRIRLSENSLWSPIKGGWEPTMQKIMVNVIQPGQVVYDLGANNGLHGLLMARLVGEKGVVYNFEPLETNVQEIEENFHLNGLTNYKNVAAAVAGSNGVEYFTVTGHLKQGAIGKSADGGAGNTVEVKVITLDTFIQDGEAGPAFIKIDIEGAEGSALRGFAGTIGKYWPLMIIELHNPEQDAEVGRFLSEHRYTAYRFDPFGTLEFKEVKDFGKGCPEADGIWGTVFCLPPGKTLNQYTFEK